MPHLSAPFTTKRFMRWLVGLLIGLNVVVMLMVVLGLMELRERDLTQASVHVRNQGEALSQILEKNIERIDNSLKTVSVELERQAKAGKLDHADIQHDIKTQKTLMGETESWTVIDSFGNVAFHQGYALKRGVNVKDRDYFIAQRADPKRGLFVSKLLTSLLSDEPIIVFSRAYLDKRGKFAGVVVLTVPVAVFQRILTSFEIGANSLIHVRDADMGLLARRPDVVHGQPYQLGNQSVTEELKQFAVGDKARASYIATSPYDNVRRLFSAHRLANGQLFAIAGLAEDEYLSNWYAVLWRAVALQAAFLLATMVAAWLVYQFWHRLQHLAYFDALTDLPNREQFVEHLKQAMVQTGQKKEVLAVCCLDLDAFQRINDVWGSKTGDLLLLQAAQRLQGDMRTGEMIARLGGDEFMLLLRNIGNRAAAARRVEQLQARLAEPMSIEEMETELTASVGITLYPEDTQDAETLIRHADQAMYAAKQAGRNRCHYFDTLGEKRVHEQRASYARLMEALDQREFQLYYQPKIDLRCGSVVGAEALIRWIHPQRGVVPPGEFLPIIENSELSVTLGEWVIHRALQQIGEWQRAGVDIKVSVNISAYHLQRPDFFDSLKLLLSDYPNISPQCLQLEILETSAMADIDGATSTIERCEQLGVSFAIDDFGTGYSSLTYFRRLPAQVLKIDRSFVQDMLEDSDDLALVKGIIGLARIFGREVVAEGVETLAHGIALIRLGCDVAQGFGIARPMPADEMLPWIASWTVPEAWRNEVHNGNN